MRTGRSGRQVPHSLREADVRPAPQLDSEGFWTLKIASHLLPTFTLRTKGTIHRTIKNKVPHANEIPIPNPDNPIASRDVLVALDLVV